MSISRDNLSATSSPELAPDLGQPTPDAALRSGLARPGPGLFDLGAAYASQTVRRAGFRAFVAYAVASLAANWPIWPGDPGRLPRPVGGDVVQSIWFLEWTPWALLHGHSVFSTAYLNYPRGVDLAQNTGMPLLGLLTAPLTLTVGPIASLNLLRFLAFCLSAYSAYWVLRHFTTFAPGAFAGGLLYGFSPYMVTQGQYHLNLSFVPLPPLILYLVYQLVASERGGPARRGLLLGLVAATQYYISAEVLATTGIVALLGVAVVCLVGIRPAPARLSRAAGGLALAAGLLAALIAYPLWASMHGPDHYIGAAQGLHNVYSADLLGPLLPTSAQLLAPARLAAAGSRLVGAKVVENGSYLSLPLLALVAVLLARDRRRAANGALVALAGAAFVISLGPRLIVNGARRDSTLRLPFALLTRLPLFDNILAVRFSLYVVMFVAVVIARGLDTEHSRWNEARSRSTASVGAARAGGRPPRAAAAAVAFLGLVSVASLLPRWPYPSGANPLPWAESPAGLALIPAGSVTLAYPYPTMTTDEAMLWQALSGMRVRLIGGYALERARHGHATVSPAVLRPAVVEGMLVNSVTLDDHPRPPTDPSLPRLLATPRTITPARVSLLREFTRDNGVQAVVVEMGQPDSREVATWFGRALGPPTRSIGGAQIWLHIEAPARRVRV